VCCEYSQETRTKTNGQLAGHEPFPAFFTVWHLSQIVCASFLVGPEFARNAEYIKDIEHYCFATPEFTHAYSMVPAPLRKAFWYLSPLGFKVRASIKKAKQSLVPEIRKRIDIWRKTGQARDEYTLLGAMLELKAEAGTIKRDIKEVNKIEEEHEIDIFADELLFLAVDSAGPIGVLVAQLLFEVVQHRNDLVEPLRKEIADALAANGGEWSDQALGSLPKLESFTRETLRFDGPTLRKLSNRGLRGATNEFSEQHALRHAACQIKIRSAAAPRHHHHGTIIADTKG
jgi:hypothetical protein